MSSDRVFIWQLATRCGDKSQHSFIVKKPHWFIYLSIKLLFSFTWGCIPFALIFLLSFIILFFIFKNGFIIYQTINQTTINFKWKQINNNNNVKFIIFFLSVSLSHAHALFSSMLLKYYLKTIFIYFITFIKINKTLAKMIMIMMMMKQRQTT